MYEISSLDRIDFGATGAKASLQNARFLLSTIQNSCPMDRQFGIDPPVDAPTEMAMAGMASQIVKVFKQYLPEITIAAINFDVDSDTGKVSPRVRVVIDDAKV